MKWFYRRLGHGGSRIGQGLVQQMRGMGCSCSLSMMILILEDEESVPSPRVCLRHSGPSATARHLPFRLHPWPGSASISLLSLLPLLFPFLNPSFPRLLVSSYVSSPQSFLLYCLSEDIPLGSAMSSQRYQRVRFPFQLINDEFIRTCLMIHAFLL